MAITLKKLSIRQNEFHLFADITIEANQTTAVIGPSGGGKSTLLMAIAGFVHPSEGSIVINQTDITDLSPSMRPVSMIFQENNLFPHLTVFQNTALGINPNLKLNTNQLADVRAALQNVGLAGREKDFPATLSGGQRQRVAIARALLRNRPVLLLDEPFAALGPALRHEMLDLIETIRANQNVTLLLVTHNPADAHRIAAATIVVADGLVSKPQPTALLFKTPPRALAEYLGTSYRSTP